MPQGHRRIGQALAGQGREQRHRDVGVVGGQVGGTLGGTGAPGSGTVNYTTGSISVTLKNNNYFARYGYSLKRVAILANDATSSLSDIAADNKLTASEKKDELPKWNAVVSEKAGYDSEADAHSVSRVAYDASLQALGTYLNGGTAWVSGDPLWFAGEHFTRRQTLTVILMMRRGRPTMMLGLTLKLR